MNSFWAIACCCAYFLLTSFVTGDVNDTTVEETVAPTDPTMTDSSGSGGSAGATLFPSFLQMLFCGLTSVMFPEIAHAIPSGGF